MRLRLILQSSPGNRVGTVELIEGGALDARDGGEGKGQHSRQQQEQQHLPEEHRFNHSSL